MLEYDPSSLSLPLVTCQFSNVRLTGTFVPGISSSPNAPAKFEIIVKDTESLEET